MDPAANLVSTPPLPTAKNHIKHLAVLDYMCIHFNLFSRSPVSIRMILLREQQQIRYPDHQQHFQYNVIGGRL